jgi:hypothetical protein
MILTGKLKYQQETCLSATLSITYPTWTGLESNLGLCSERLEPLHNLFLALNKKRLKFTLQHAMKDQRRG